MFVYVWGGERRLEESLHPLTHPPLLLFFLFWPNFFLRLAFFVAGQRRAFLK